MGRFEALQAAAVLAIGPWLNEDAKRAARTVRKPPMKSVPGRLTAGSVTRVQPVAHTPMHTPRTATR